MSNAQLVSHVLRQLQAGGVEEYCICPSSRNAPFVASLKANDLKTHTFFEERSMAFFALGRIRDSGRPVAVLTTSGTAAGELLPATMEAHYAGLPLVLVTSDRPRRYRGSGAPQAAEQVGLFGIYVSHSLDIEGDERPEFSDLSFDQPLHLNICFDEPLLEGSYSSFGGQPGSQENDPYRMTPVASSPFLPKTAQGELTAIDSSRHQIRDFLQKARNPLVLVGALAPAERESVAQLLLQWQMPVYLEGLSGLREEERLAPYRIHLADRMVDRAQQAGYPLDGILRVGGVPTHRFWRDLEGKLSHLPVLTLSRLPFSGLGRPSALVRGVLSELCGKFLAEVVQCGESRARRRWFELDREAHQSLRTLLLAEPSSEAGIIAALSERIPEASRIYLGNSLPIREWDLAATPSPRKYEVWGSRGLNGIDGQVSTFLGFARKETENWAILGDLTALYDLPGPWILSQMSEFPVRLLIVNNGGGKIFSRMFPQKEFQNCHQLRFKGWADLWGLPYEEWREIPSSLSGRRGSHQMIEVVPDEGATHRFWKKFAEI